MNVDQMLTVNVRELSLLQDIRLPEVASFLHGMPTFMLNLNGPIHIIHIGPLTD